MNNRSEHVRFLPIYYSLYPGPAEFASRYSFFLASSRSASNSLRPHSLIRWFPTSQVAIHASSKQPKRVFRAGVSRAHWDYFCWTVRFDASPGEHGQSTGLAECEMVHINLGFGAPRLASYSGALASAPILYGQESCKKMEAIQNIFCFSPCGIALDTLPLAPVHSAGL